MQSLVTKWFKPMDPSKVGQYHDWLFEKEKEDREKRIAEREAKIRARRKPNQRRKKERERLRQIQREKEKKRKEADRVRRELEAQKRAEWAKRKLEGQEVVPGIFIGGRLAAQNYDWLNTAINNHNLSSILNCTPNIRNYFDLESKSTDTDDLPLQELEELAQQLEQVHEDAKPIKPDPLAPEASQETALLGESQESSLPPPEPKLLPPLMSSDGTDATENAAEGENGASEANKPEEDDFFAQMENMDDDAKLALLESIKLPGDEEKVPIVEEPEPVEDEKEDEAKKMLEMHKQRLTMTAPALKLSYRRIPIDDDGRIDVQEWFTVANEFISEAREKGEAVLIHCREGRSRSVTMTIAYMIISLKMTLNEAMEKVKAVILDENIQFGFKTQLMKLDSSVHGTHSVDYTDRRRRNATMNVSYSDVAAGGSGSTRRSKRTKRTKQVSTEEDDAEYNASVQELAPPTKVKATTRSLPKSRVSPKKDPVAPSNGSDTPVPVSETSTADITNGHTGDSAKSNQADEKMAVDEMVDVESSNHDHDTSLVASSDKSSAMEVDAAVATPKKEKSPQKAKTSPKSKPKPDIKPAASTDTNKDKKPTKTASPAGTPSKSKKKAILPVQKNNMLNYFTKA